MIKIAALKEPEFEKRVALTPEAIQKSPYKEKGFLIENCAGKASGYEDADYPDTVSFTSRKQVLEQAKIIFALHMPDEESRRLLRSGTILMGMLDPHHQKDAVTQLARLGVSAFSLELLPRVTRAQFMDVLSSQSSLAGYQATVQASALLGRTFPAMMTAAGNVSAARVLIIGAGVAGLQAIATARRLGAIVSAFDVRSSSQKEVESLGAKFIQVDSEEVGDASGGYAKEMSESYKKAQAQKLLEVMAQQDVVITTAQIPNKPAPRIITKEMVLRMKSGSIIIDLAGNSGGNCELSQLGKTVEFEGKRILAPSHILNDVARTASQFFSTNMLTFVKQLLTIDEERVTFDLDDPLIHSTLITFEGRSLWKAE